MGESVFSLRKKPPGLQKGFRRFRFRRGGSHPADASVRGPIVRVACCRFGLGPLRGGSFSRLPPVSRPFIFAAGSSFVFRSVAAGVVVCPRSGSRRA